MKFSKTAILLAFVFLLCLAQPASSQACDSHNVTAYINYTNGVHPGALTGGIRDNNNGQIVFVSCSNCSYSNATGVLTVDLVEFDPANCSNAGDILTIYANDTLNNLGATNVTRSASSPTDAGTVVIQTAPTTTTTTTTSTTTTTTTTTTTSEATTTTTTSTTTTTAPGDTQPPGYANVTINNTNPMQGDMIRITGNWFDDVNLAEASLRMNRTDENFSFADTRWISGTQNSSSFLFDTRNGCGGPCGGRTIGWNVWVRDLAGNWNDTMPVSTFYVEPPRGLNLTIIDSNGNLTGATVYLYDGTKKLVSSNWMCQDENPCTWSPLAVGSYIVVGYLQQNNKMDVETATVSSLANVLLNLTTDAGFIDDAFYNISSSSNIHRMNYSSVNASLYHANGTLAYAADTTSQEEYNFRIPIPQGVQYYLGFKAAGFNDVFYRALVRLASGDTWVSGSYGLYSGPTANFTGYVLDENGSPVGNANVKAYLRNLPGINGDVTVGSGVSQSGVYAITVPRNYTVNGTGFCLDGWYNNPNTPGYDYLTDWSSNPGPCNRNWTGSERGYIAPSNVNVSVAGAGTIAGILNGGNGTVRGSTLSEDDYNERYDTLWSDQNQGVVEDGGSYSINLRSGIISVYALGTDQQSVALERTALVGVGNLTSINLTISGGVRLNVTFRQGNSNVSFRGRMIVAQGSSVLYIDNVDEGGSSIVLPSGVYNITMVAQGENEYNDMRAVFYNKNVSQGENIAVNFTKDVRFEPDMSDNIVVNANTVISLRLVEESGVQLTGSSGWMPYLYLHYSNNTYSGFSVQLNYSNSSSKFVGTMNISQSGEYNAKYVAEREGSPYRFRMTSTGNIISVSGLSITVNLGREDRFMLGENVSGTLQVKYPGNGSLIGNATANVTILRMVHETGDRVEMEALTSDITNGLGNFTFSTGNYSGGEYLIRVVVNMPGYWSQTYRWFSMQTLSVTGEGSHSADIGSVVSVTVTVKNMSSSPVPGVTLETYLREDRSWTSISARNVTTNASGVATVNYTMESSGNFNIEVIAKKDGDEGRYYHWLQVQGLSVSIGKEGGPPVIVPDGRVNMTVSVEYKNGSAVEEGLLVYFELRDDETWDLMDTFPATQESGSKYKAEITAPAVEGAYMLRAIGQKDSLQGEDGMPLTVSQLSVDLMPDSWDKNPGESMLLNVRARYALNSTPVDGVTATAEVHKDFSWEVEVSNSTNMSNGVGNILLQPPGGAWSGGFHPVEVSFSGFTGSFFIGFITQNTNIQINLTPEQPAGGYASTDVFVVEINVTDSTTNQSVSGGVDLFINSFVDDIYKQCTLVNGLCNVSIDLGSDFEGGNAIGGDYNVEVFTFGDGIAGNSRKEFTVQGLVVDVITNKPSMQKYLPGENVSATVTATYVNETDVASGEIVCDVVEPMEREFEIEANGTLSNGTGGVSFNTTELSQGFYVLVCDVTSGTISGQGKYPLTVSAMDVRVSTDKKTYLPTENVTVTVNATLNTVKVNGSVDTTVFGPHKEHYSSGTMVNGDYEKVMDLVSEYGGSVPTGDYFWLASVSSGSDIGSQCLSFMVQSMQIAATFNTTAEFDPGQAYSLTFNVTDSGLAVENATVRVNLVNPRVGIVSTTSNTTNASGIYVLSSTAPLDEGSYVYLVAITSGDDEAMDEVPFRVKGNTATVVMLDSSGNFRNIFSSNENATIRVNLTNSAGSPVNATVKLKILDARTVPVYTDSSYLIAQSRDLSYNVTGLSGWYYANVYTASDAEIGSGAFRVIA